jgi:pyruvate/2-oxoglutarate dehydrogenase complex dihydrolipoamide acyltransferase (E2) component
VPIEVKMAKLSPTMESGQLVKWLVKVGDKVKEGDTLAEIQTDKAVMPMESFEEGTVAHLDVQEGDEIALGQRVLVLAKKGRTPRPSPGRSARRRPRPPRRPSRRPPRRPSRRPGRRSPRSRRPSPSPRRRPRPTAPSAR